MSGVSRMCGSFLVALLLIAGVVTPATAASASRSEQEAELARVRERIQALRGELEADRSRYDRLRTELRSTERHIGEVARVLEALDGQLESQKAKLRELRGEQGALEASVGHERERLARQVRSAYMAGRQELVKILLNQEDPAKVGRVMTYYDYLNRARSERIAAFLEKLEALEAVHRSIAAEQRRVEVLHTRQRTEMDALERAQTDRNTLLVELRRELRTKDQQLSALLEDEKELEAVIRVITEALGDIPSVGREQPFSALKGRMPWPAKGSLAVQYGAKHELGDFRWRGVLIAAPEGGEVRAIAHGRVAFADWLRGYGLLLIIDHGQGYMSLYGHNRSLYKETGDWIEGGEVIAQVGRSGGQEASAVYFEIRKDGRPINPALWCRG